MKHTWALSIVFFLGILASVQCLACTSALVSAGRSLTSHPLLWKHRDTGAPFNHIMHHAATDSTFEYIALHNGEDPAGCEAWIGINRAGLAIMNTASYNLMPDTAAYKDREGFVMSAALEQCRTVNDVCRLLDTLPRPLGVQANFGILDAEGNQVYLETDDYNYTMYSVPGDSLIVRTNYSHSGGTDGRLGVARERTADHALGNRMNISTSLLLDTLSARYFDPVTGEDMIAAGQRTALDNGDLIPRYISTASIVIEAVPSPQADGSNYIMWAKLGFPPAAALYKVTFDSMPPDVLRGDDGITHAERDALKLKNQIYSGERQGKARIVNLQPLSHLNNK